MPSTIKKPHNIFVLMFLSITGFYHAQKRQNTDSGTTPTTAPIDARNKPDLQDINSVFAKTLFVYIIPITLMFAIWYIFTGIPHKPSLTVKPETVVKSHTQTRDCTSHLRHATITTIAYTQSVPTTLPELRRSIQMTPQTVKDLTIYITPECYNYLANTHDIEQTANKTPLLISMVDPFETETGFHRTTKIEKDDLVVSYHLIGPNTLAVSILDHLTGRALETTTRITEPNQEADLQFNGPASQLNAVISITSATR